MAASRLMFSLWVTALPAISRLEQASRGAIQALSCKIMMLMFRIFPTACGEKSIISIYLDANIAAGFDANNSHLMKSLANGLHQPGGVATTVSAWDEEVGSTPAFPLIRSAYLSVDV